MLTEAAIRARRGRVPNRWPLSLRPVFALVVLLFAATPAGAVEVYGLYEAEVAVADKSTPERDRALGRLLLMVATKVSGQRDVAENPVLAQAAEHPGAYVQQFRYRAAAAGPAPAPESYLESDPETESETEPESEPESGSRPQAQASSGLLLWARFDPRAVGELLRRAELPVWGRIRPSLLVWLAVERDDGRELVGADDAGPLLAALERAAARRGLPLVLPLLDLEDRVRLRVSDVWAGFDEAILEASQRYQSKAVLVGRIYRSVPTMWEARWRLFMGDAVQEWSTEGSAAALALEAGIHRATDALVARFARPTGESDASDVALVVRGVRSLEDYARTLAYLQSLELADAVRVTRVQGDEVSFRLRARGGEQALTQLISFSRTLAPTQQLAGEAARALEFRLLP